MLLKRKVYEKLLEWKNSNANRSLMIKGARQVGKTFFIREFGKKEYKSYVHIAYF